MADEVVAGAAAIGQLRSFALKFLDIVLAEIAQAQLSKLRAITAAGNFLVTAISRISERLRPARAAAWRCGIRPGLIFL